MTTAIALAVYAVLLAIAAAAVWRRPVVALYLWIVGVALHNSVGAALYGAGVRGSELTAIQAWKEILLAVGLGRVVFDVARSRTLPFRPLVVDWLAVAYGALVCIYALIPQHVLGGAADSHAVALALKHNLVPVGAYFLGRSVIVRREQLVPIAWTLIGAAAVVAAWGLIDDYAISISWWRSSAVVPYFHKQLGYDYHGTGGLPENFIYNTGSEQHFLRRLVSVFLSPLATAFMLTVALLLGAALWRRARVLAALCVVVAAGLLFTFSRSSLIALAAGLLVLAFVARLRWPLIAAAVTIGVFVGWVHVFPHIAPQGHWTKQDLLLQRQISKRNPTATGNPVSTSEPSIREHLTSLRDGARTVVHHPQGFGLGNAGQTASRTGTPIKAGESNYTEMGAEMGILGSVLWTAWIVALLVALVRAARRTRWWAAVGVAAAFAAAAVLAIQTDVIGDPWMGYVLWMLTGIAVAPPALRGSLHSFATVNCKLVADIAVVAADEVLLVRYRDVSKYDGEAGWFLPDDYLVRLEHPDDAARRILLEQTGIESADLRLAEIESFNGEAWHLVFHYVAGLEEPVQIPNEGNIAEAQWFPVDSLPETAEIAHHGWARDVLGRVLAI